MNPQVSSEIEPSAYQTGSESLQSFGRQPVTDRGMARLQGYSLPSGRAPAPSWFALVVRPNQSFAVRDALRKLEIAEYLPTTTKTTRWSDRQKTTEVPLFPGYLFARLDPDQINIALALTGVTQLLPSNMKPISINAAEIANLRVALDAYQETAQPCAYVEGTPVTIVSGPLQGVSGTIVRTSNTRDKTRLLVGIEGLARAVSVELSADDVVKR